ncbi:hypothetical protein RRG08_018586 [Elysia crispata]|uniref:Uncharacterized protein n=1 Tax=Elysia crispata TaxID=231223 RepID=A0AAE1DTX9_9GAST|nr:hypothetical protein RRG08_018586 [Elysia crispata]
MKPCSGKPARDGNLITGKGTLITANGLSNTKIGNPRHFETVCSPRLSALCGSRVSRIELLSSTAPTSDMQARKTEPSSGVRYHEISQDYEKNGIKLNCYQSIVPGPGDRLQARMEITKHDRRKQTPLNQGVVCMGVGGGEEGRKHNEIDQKSTWRRYVETQNNNSDWHIV